MPGVEERAAQVRAEEARRTGDQDPLGFGHPTTRASPG